MLDVTKTATAVIGFDSAWSNRAAGAVCAIVRDSDGRASFVAPELADFQYALNFIGRICADKRVIAIDQPTIVINATGMRPVERVVASPISYAGGGVQPANCKRQEMFGLAAPIWDFKKQLGAAEDPNVCRASEAGDFIIEVYPALALLSWEPAFAERRKFPRYNPSNRRKFNVEDWRRVLTVVKRVARDLGIDGVSDWIRDLPGIPKKSHQDQLDSIVCAMVGFKWLEVGGEPCAMVGDVSTGYIIAPVRPHTLERLRCAAERLRCAPQRLDVPIFCKDSP